MRLLILLAFFAATPALAYIAVDTKRQEADLTLSTQSITAQDTASTTVTGFANQSLISGTPTTGSVASYTVSSVQTIMVIVKGTWTGTLEFDVSEDNGSTWEPRSAHVIGTSTFSATTTGNMAGSINAAGKTGFRVRSIAAITGTASITIVTSDNPSNVYIANAAQIVDGSSVPALNKLTIKAASTPAAPTDTAAVFESPATLYKHITTSATTVVKSGSGKLAKICFNSFIVPVLGSATVATVYDNTAGSGTEIAVVTGPGSTQIPFCLDYQLAFTTGLTIVTTNINTSDITVTYR